MKVEYRWTEAQFLRLALYDYEVGPRSARTKTVLLLVIFTLLGLMVINWFYRGLQFSVWDLVLIAVGLCWYSLRGPLLVRMFNRAFKRSGMDGLNLCFDVKEEGIHIQVTDRPEQQLAWSDIRKVIRTREGFLVYPGPMWLPSAKLEDGADTEALAALLKRKATDYQDRSQHQLKLKD